MQVLDLNGNSIINYKVSHSSPRSQIPWGHSPAPTTPMEITQTVVGVYSTGTLLLVWCVVYVVCVCMCLAMRQDCV